MAEDVFGIVGSVIAGAYQVESVVAEGGFGVVYRAHHGGFRAPVALKLLKVPQQNPEQRAEFLEMFRAEAELLFRLSASLPAVVRPLHVDAFTTADGRFVPYLVLEWLEGLTLDALIRERNRAGLAPVPLRKLVRLLTPVARALERAHHFSGPEGTVCIVHRDLKPENIFIAQVAGEEVVKILDFGIGKVKTLASQVAGRMSQDGRGLMAFTPAYGAPEQWAPRHYGQTGPWTDVWGLALCLVEVLAARQLIEGDPATMMGIALDPQRRPTPRNEGIELPAAVEAVFERALALDPRARQHDVGLFWNELVAALQIPSSERGDALPRDARSEGGGGLRVERIERREGPSGSSGTMSRVAQPSAAVERMLAMDLEFDLPSASQASQRMPVVERVEAVPVSAPRVAPAERASAVSGQHFVPDLELAPAPVSRRSSGAQIVAQQAPAQSSVLDLDDASGASGLLNLDLDLPANEPRARRTASSGGMPATQPNAPQKRLSGSMSVVREPGVSSSSGGVSTTPSSTPELALDLSEPPPARGSVPPPRASVPPRSPAPPAESGSHFEAGFVAKLEANLPKERSLMRRLRLPLSLLGAAVVVAILDPIYAAASGEVLLVLGLRLSLLAGALLVLALGLAFRELARENN